MHRPEETDPDYEARQDAIAESIKRVTQERFKFFDQRPGPAIAYDIPKELDEKAQKHQDQLTDAEPPTDSNHENIKNATNGELMTVDGLIAKARADIASFNEAELDLLANNFNSKATRPSINANYVPGTLEALELLMSPVEKEVISAARRLWAKQLAKKRPLLANIPPYHIRHAKRSKLDAGGPKPYSFPSVLVRPRLAFLFYSIVQWEKVLEENPSVLELDDLCKILENKWSAMSQEGQARYEKDAAA